jgi:hypothetical protein
MPATRYGPWLTYDGIRESAGDALIPPGWVPSVYRTAFPAGGSQASGHKQYAISESHASYLSGLTPGADTAARLCALAHIAEGDGTGYINWDPGECAAVPAPPSTYSSSGTFAARNRDIAVGTTSSVHPPDVPPLTPSQYILTGWYGVYGMAWWNTKLDFGLPVGPEDRFPSIQCLLQIPGWLDAIGKSLTTGQEPQVEVLRLDGEAWLALDGTTDISVSGCDRPAPPWLISGGLITPYSRMGSAAMTAGPGGTSGVLSFPDMQLGDAHFWDLKSSRIAAGTDPGAAEDHSAIVHCHSDFVWSIRVRFPGIPPLRWLNRDDGLGVTGARRWRTGTSLQTTTRHRGYR